MIQALMDTEVEIVRYGPTGEDDLGRPVRGEVSRTESIARIEQRGSIEGEAFVADRWRASLPWGIDIDADDELHEGGRTFRVDGTPNIMSIPGFPALDRVEVELLYVGRVDA